MRIFRRFPTTFRRFPKIFQNCTEGQTNVPEHFPRISENSRSFPKIAEDYRGRPEDASMIHQLFQVQFKRQTWYQQNHRYLHMWGYHIFTCEDIVSFLSICYHSVYHWLLYNKRCYLNVRRPGSLGACLFFTFTNHKRSIRLNLNHGTEM